MSTPGWYPDPQDNTHERFWDGSTWTTQVRESPQSSPATPLTPESSPGRGSTVRLWLALVLALGLVVGGGWWLLLGGGRGTSPEVAVESPSPSASKLIPLKLPARAPQSLEASAPPTTAVGSTQIQVGSQITALTDCPSTATDSVGAVDNENRVSSSGGLSIAAIDGFDPHAIPFGFIHQANSQVKTYPESNWMASVTVGTLRGDEGFTDLVPSATRVIGCLLGGQFYPDGAIATVVDISEGEDAAWFDVSIPISGIADVTADLVSVAIVKRDNVLHIVLVVTPNHDQAGYDTVMTALDTLRLA